MGCGAVCGWEGIISGWSVLLSLMAKFAEDVEVLLLRGLGSVDDA
jgi:hypothetical protein